MGDDKRAAAESAARVSIRAIEDEFGLHIHDTIERRRCEILTDGPVEATPIRSDDFQYPVDTAVKFTAKELSLDSITVVFVHNAGNITEIDHFDTVSFGDGSYTLELHGPMKAYLRVDGPIEVHRGINESTVSLDRPRTVRLGARSLHERPAATVTTTTKPKDVMAAVSTFGSAMKTTGSDRSYPTLRGHPPALQEGDELSIPNGIEHPETDIHIEVPESIQDVFVVAPLAYYLGARVVSGNDPRLVAGEEQYSLVDNASLEESVERVLKQTFFLDCLVRTAGERPVPLYEYEKVAPALDIDIDSLYGRPGAERLQSYLTVPFEDVVDYIPTWKLVSHVAPHGDSLEVLSFLVNDLSVIRSPPDRTPPEQSKTEAVFTPSARSDGGTGLVRKTSGSDSDKRAKPRVNPGQTNSLEQAWVGPGMATGASKAIPEAFWNRLDRDPREEEIEIVVVCNDEEMVNERDVVEDVYGSRDELLTDVTVYEEVSTDALSLILGSDIDFFHYIGHVDDEGFECTDGKLDVETLDTVSIDIFFLNACRSYEQGSHLIENGAISGVVTLDDVINSGAVRIGKTLAELLNYGFPLRSALDLARERSIVGSQYLVIGYGNADIAQVESGAPLLADVCSDGGYHLDVTIYTTSDYQLGSVFRPSIPGVDYMYLIPSTLPTFNLATSTLSDYLASSVFPVRMDGELTWSDQVSL